MTFIKFSVINGWVIEEYDADRWGVIHPYIDNWVVSLSYITPKEIVSILWGGGDILLMLAKYWDSVLAKSGCTTRGNPSIDQ